MNFKSLLPPKGAKELEDSNGVCLYQASAGGSEFVPGPEVIQPGRWLLVAGGGRWCLWFHPLPELIHVALGDDPLVRGQAEHQENHLPSHGACLYPCPCLAPDAPCEEAKSLRTSMASAFTSFSPWAVQRIGKK